MKIEVAAFVLFCGIGFVTDGLAERFIPAPGPRGATCFSATAGDAFIGGVGCACPCEVELEVGAADATVDGCVRRAGAALDAADGAGDAVLGGEGGPEEACG